MIKAAKIFRIVALALLCVALVLALSGTVLMFMARDYLAVDSYYDYYNYYDYYDGYSSYNSYDFMYAPWVGVMPLFGTFMLIAALICIVVANKKVNASIATIVTSAIGIDLFVFSIFLLSWNEYNILPIIGYFIGVGAAVFLWGALLLSVLFRVFMGIGSRPKKEKAPKVAEEEQAEGAPKKRRPLTPYYIRLEQAATVLKELKALLDAGVLTEEEFRREKASVFERFEIAVARNVVESASSPYTKATE